MRIRREVVGALCALLVTACAAAAAGPDDTASEAPLSTTLGGVGVLPAPLPTQSGATEQSDEETLPAPSTTVRSTSTTTTALHADGNRILLLGDSILASTSRRYSNDTCKALVPLGWRVEVEAEVSRGIQFGNEVLKQRMSAGWDVGVVMLGTNDGANSTEYLKQLNKIITTFTPRPVVLVTVPEFKPEMQGINGTIRAIAEVYPGQVTVLDWNQITQEQPEVLNVDGIHPTPHGRQVLAEAIAAHVGRAPSEPGECLQSVYTDDSAGSVDGGGKNTGTTVKPRNTGATTTTVNASGGTPTTVKPSTSSSTPSGSSTSAPSGPITLVPQTTVPPVTAPPTVAPTAPPTVASTSPPVTPTTTI